MHRPQPAQQVLLKAERMFIPKAKPEKEKKKKSYFLTIAEGLDHKQISQTFEWGFPPPSKLEHPQRAATSVD